MMYKAPFFSDTIQFEINKYKNARTKMNFEYLNKGKQTLSLKNVHNNFDDYIGSENWGLHPLYKLSVAIDFFIILDHSTS